ncbi:hypothetical protein IU450_37165 [Nocardia abscessus]|uniref:hypothetical protein n=1 Tax=Nocardia abscessus TaxID=120957 RepID=UPI001895571F|nr:hypothetical protein [Nocardia abscessus]MBF6341472.1 hypothetical protein [Nocardia abscessus]
MNKKVRATVSALAIAFGIVIASSAATADPAAAPATAQRQEAMAGFSAPPCLPLILPPAVNVNAFLICLV